MGYKTEFSDNKRVLLVINPKAGRTSSTMKIDTFRKTLEKYGFLPDLYMTEYPKHATQIVAEHGGDYDMVVCSGGDGTLNEIVTGMMKLERRPVLGYLPAGTTNDFAKTLRLPRMLEMSVAMMSKGKSQTIDCGSFNDDNVASFGAFTRSSYSTPQDVKNVLGKGAYLFDTVQSAFEIRPYHARITTDNAVYEDDFLFGAVANTLSIGGFINMPRDLVNLSDGKFELLLIRNVENPEDFPDTLRACLDLTYDHENVILTQSSYVKIELDEDVPFTTDGEYAGALKTVEIHDINPGYDLLIP